MQNFFDRRGRYKNEMPMKNSNDDGLALSVLRHAYYSLDGEVCGFSAAKKVANGAVHACFICDVMGVSAITQRVMLLESRQRLIFNAPIRKIISSSKLSP